MNKLLATAFFIFSLYGCSSSRLVDEYRNAETPNFQANKVLVVGLTSDPVLQRQFEYSLQQALETEDVIAVKSVDYFESTFSENNQTEEMEEYYTDYTLYSEKWIEDLNLKIRTFEQNKKIAFEQNKK